MNNECCVDFGKETIDKVSKILRKIPGLTTKVRKLIISYSLALFNNGRVRRLGYKRFLKSKNPAYKSWGAAVLLEKEVRDSKSSNRKISSEIIKQVKTAFIDSAKIWESEHHACAQNGRDMRVLSKNIHVIIKIHKKIK